MLFFNLYLNFFSVSIIFIFEKNLKFWKFCFFSSNFFNLVFFYVFIIFMHLLNYMWMCFSKICAVGMALAPAPQPRGRGGGPVPPVPRPLRKCPPRSSPQRTPNGLTRTNCRFQLPFLGLYSFPTCVAHTLTRICTHRCQCPDLLSHIQIKPAPLAVVFEREFMTPEGGFLGGLVLGEAEEILTTFTNLTRCFRKSVGWIFFLPLGRLCPPDCLQVIDGHAAVVPLCKTPLWRQECRLTNDQSSERVGGTPARGWRGCSVARAGDSLDTNVT